MERGKKYILIENRGEIDINALVLMGGSTKRDSETAIGFYGSGNKYAIALMLRKGIPFRMFRGLEEVAITTEEVPFRDKSFHKIMVNGQQTSLTTDMGPQWDSWMGIREWVSNAIDEGGHSVVNATDEIRPKEGYTRIYVEHHPDIVAVIERWDRFFSMDREDVIVDTADGKIYPQNDVNDRMLYYRKGIQCYEPVGSKSLYCYDVPTITINESRVCDNTYGARTRVTKLLIKHATKQIARNILDNVIKEGYIEQNMDWYHDTYGIQMNQAWRDAIGDKIIINHDTSGFFMNLMKTPHYIVTKSLARKIKDQFPDVQVYGVGKDGDECIYQQQEETAKMKYLLKRANEFLADVKYTITHPVEIVTFNKPDTLARAQDGKILLSTKLFDDGIRAIVVAMMEEEEHLVTKYEDESREMQNHLFNKWLSTLEEMHGAFL